jgi:multidrug efflux pump subunit AcrA (membrane-fusion protein)
LKSNNTSHLRRWLLPVIFILVGVALYSLLILFKKESPITTTKAKIWPVNVMQVKLQAHAPVLTVYGVVENPGVLKIKTPGSSYISTLPVTEGQIVNQDDLLVQLDQRDFMPKVQSAEAEELSVQAEISSLKLRHAMDASTHQTENKMLALTKLQLSRTEMLKEKNWGLRLPLIKLSKPINNSNLQLHNVSFQCRNIHIKSNN